MPYQLTDPHRSPLPRCLTNSSRDLGRTLIRLRLPLGAVKSVVNHVPGVSRWVQLPSQVFDYLSHRRVSGRRRRRPPWREAGRLVPRFSAYVDRLVEFVRQHPHLGSAERA